MESVHQPKVTILGGFSYFFSLFLPFMSSWYVWYRPGHRRKLRKQMQSHSLYHRRGLRNFYFSLNFSKVNILG